MEYVNNYDKLLDAWCEGYGSRAEFFADSELTEADIAKLQSAFGPDPRYAHGLASKLWIVVEADAYVDLAAWGAPPGIGVHLTDRVLVVTVGNDEEWGRSTFTYAYVSSEYSDLYARSMRDAVLGAHRYRIDLVDRKGRETYMHAYFKGAPSLAEVKALVGQPDMKITSVGVL